MGFIENILGTLGFDQTPNSEYRAVIIGGSAVYIENVKGLKKYTLDEIEFYLKKGELTVKGEQLYIKKYCAGDVVICGKINAIQKN